MFSSPGLNAASILRVVKLSEVARVGNKRTALQLLIHALGQSCQQKDKTRKFLLSV